ncbi:hypothetical protein M0805_000466 [Coniferiporia weirii]|nr:hypothetical protein M0805_000466 [Coniferiporia weirii]
MSTTALLSELNVIATDVMIVRYTTIATLCLVVYDYLVSLEEEIRLVWPSKLSFAKLVFLLNRYLPFSTAISATYAILFLRAYAVWGKSPIVYWLLIFIFLGEAAGAYYTTALFISSVIPSTEIRLFSSGCLLTFPSRVDWISLVILIFSETFTLTMLLIRGFGHFRYSRSTVVRTLYKDGVFYYVTVLAVTVANFVVMRTASSFLCSFLFNTQGAIHNILCTRLLLRIRGAYESLSINTTLRENSPWKQKVHAPEQSYVLTDISGSSA